MRFEAIFGKFRPKNRVFSVRTPPLKLVYFGAVYFRKTQNSTKGGPFVSAWGRIPEGRGGFDPMPTQRVPPLCYFEISLFG